MRVAGNAIDIVVGQSLPYGDALYVWLVAIDREAAFHHAAARGTYQQRRVGTKAQCENLVVGEEAVGPVVAAKVLLRDVGFPAVGAIDAVVGTYPQASVAVDNDRLDAALVHPLCEVLPEPQMVNVAGIGYEQSTVQRSYPDASLRVLTDSGDMVYGQCSFSAALLVVSALHVDALLVGARPEMSLPVEVQGRDPGRQRGLFLKVPRSGTIAVESPPACTDDDGAVGRMACQRADGICPVALMRGFGQQQAVAVGLFGQTVGTGTLRAYPDVVLIVADGIGQVVGLKQWLLVVGSKMGQLFAPRPPNEESVAVCGNKETACIVGCDVELTSLVAGEVGVGYQQQRLHGSLWREDPQASALVGNEVIAVALALVQSVADGQRRGLPVSGVYGVCTVGSEDHHLLLPYETGVHLRRRRNPCYRPPSTFHLPLSTNYLSLLRQEKGTLAVGGGSDDFLVGQ